MTALLSYPITWLSVARAVDAGRACRDYLIYDEERTPRYQARAYAWRREIVLHPVSAPHHPLVSLRRRRSFPLSGQVDVIDAAGTRIGVVRRNGAYRDSEWTSGRFRDARTLGAFAREGVVIGVLDALAGSDGSSLGSGPRGFIWLLGTVPVGTLTRGRPPLDAAPPRAPVPLAPVDHAGTTRIARLAQRLRQLVQPSAPAWWKLERQTGAPAGDERVVAAAALFAIELSHW